MSKKQSKYLLYLDTADTEAVLGLADVNEEFPTFHFERWQSGRELSATLSGKFKSLMLEYAIAPSDLAGICVFVGPGSFTGLRIGISFANGLAYALSIPMYETRKKEELNLHNPKEFVTPEYGSDPKITRSKK